MFKKSLIFTLLISSISVYAGECGKLEKNEEILTCFNKKINKLEGSTYNLIKKNKRLRKEQLKIFEKILDNWKLAQISYCEYANQSGLEIDKLNQAGCLIENWEQRLDLTKKDLKRIKPKKIVKQNLENLKKVSFQELEKNNENFYKFLKMNSFDDKLTNQQIEKFKQYHQYWKEFAINYALITNGNKTLSEMIKAKNNLLQIEINNY